MKNVTEKDDDIDVMHRFKPLNDLPPETKSLMEDFALHVAEEILVQWTSTDEPEQREAEKDLPLWISDMWDLIKSESR